MFVGGEISGGSALAIVDLSDFSSQLVNSAGGEMLAEGGVKGAVLISTKSDGTYAYFTVNNAVSTDYVSYTSGGGVYSYKLGDEEAKLIYDAAGHNQYCDSPVICDGQGNLYYINDSGTLFKLQEDSVVDETMHRLYNSFTGEHLYTKNTDEKDNLVALGWDYEGEEWTAPSKSETPVYRLFNKYVEGGDHHYTTDKKEYDDCIAEGWTDEGVGWYSDDAKGVPLYRQYNPFAVTGTHNYTTSKGENDHLVSLGWREEEVGWYGVSTE